MGSPPLGYPASMSGQHEDTHFRPIGASREAFDWLGGYGDVQVEQSMATIGARVRGIVPECVALSISMTEDDLTFTLMCDKPGAALLDAMQYLDGGPCVAAVDRGSLETTRLLPTDEGLWQLFARAESFAGIASTLSLPVMKDEEAIGGVNLYASTAHAFDGHHDEVAAVCGAWAQGAVTNADLSFSSRIRAAAAPERLRDRGTFDVACGYVAAHQHLQISEAAERIRIAARRAGVSDLDFARFILSAHEAREA
jgi:hypothetical protein